MPPRKTTVKKATVEASEEPRVSRHLSELAIGDTFSMGGMRYKLLSVEEGVAKVGELIYGQIVVGINDDGTKQLGVTEYLRSIVELPVDTEIE